MADCHKQFGEFHGKIELNDSSKSKLEQGRDAIRDLIRADFREKGRTPVPAFEEQGSWAMGTIINPLPGDEFDLDDGVYLQNLDKKSKTDWPTAETVHSWIVDAVDGHTMTPPIDKRTCVRVVYADDYHIDLPIYSDLNGTNMHAVKGETGWHFSDPVEITKWFKEAVKTNGTQLKRTVRYFKAWADFNTKDGKLPSGLILTVLAVQNFRANERDDKCFVDTARAIQNAISAVFHVANPKDASEELTSRLDDDQKKRFQDAIANLATEGQKAVDAEKTSEASTIWKKRFGDRFPTVEDDPETEQKKKDAERLASAYVSTKPWMPL